MCASPSVYHRRPLTGPAYDLAFAVREWPDATLEEERDRWFDLWAEYTCEPVQDSAAYARWKHDTLQKEVERRASLRDQFAHDPSVPVWTEGKMRRYQELRQLVDFLRSEWPIDRFMTELMAIDLRPAGSERMKGRCPFHDDRNPSMTVYVDQGTYYCFACGVWGDVFDCVGRHFGLDDFRAQVEKLAEATPNLPQNDSPRSQTLGNREGRNNSRRRSGVRLVGGKVVAA